MDLPAQAAGRPAESGVWASKKQLVEQIMYYIKGYNEAAAAFSWNYTGKPLTV